MKKIVCLAGVAMLLITVGTLTAHEVGGKNVVFDGLKQGDNGKGWAVASQATISAQDKVVRAAGRKALEFHAQGCGWMGVGWNWLGWSPEHGGTDISGYGFLSFWAKLSGDKMPGQLKVKLVASDKTTSEEGDLLKYCPALSDGDWHELTIPIKDLDAEGALNRAKVWEINFGVWSQDEVNFGLFVDEIGFEGKRSPADHPQANPAGGAAPGTVIGGLPMSEQIMVDQFGFRPQSEKIIIFASPQEGQNVGTHYLPPSKAIVRREKDGSVTLSVALQPWGGGKTDKTSGDKVWYADISALREPGAYYIYDAENGVRSYGFRVADDVYLPVLKAAVRAFFYQRCGGDIPEANGGTWHHPACHVAAGQDLAAQLYVDGNVKGQPRDVHGGWHDAGDYNKYVPFTSSSVITLLMAYESNPSVFGDDWNIPESGNGVPDILDEVRWECDWLLRMQMPDGSVCNRVTECSSKPGVTPDLDTGHERYYTQPTSWATATCAADLACFARVIAPFLSQAAVARTYRAAAEKAWAWLEAHPEMTPADGKDHGRPSEAADASTDRASDLDCRVMAAVELWLLDPQPKYEAFIKKWHKDTLSPWFFEYAASPKADRAVAADVRAALKKFVDDQVIGIVKSQADAYRSYLPGYWWGCNQTKTEYGYRAICAVKLGVVSADEQVCRTAAEDYLHYLHGRNPLCVVYLTNMGPKGANLGAGKSIMRPFHTWFSEGSPWSGPDSLGPAPGLLVGGPNTYDAPPWLVPPAKQPPSKSFRDWAGVWNEAHQATENSWAFTEPDIGYQGNYVLLLAQFVAEAEHPSATR